jgi:hypothetical protein
MTNVPDLQISIWGKETKSDLLTRTWDFLLFVAGVPTTTTIGE